MKAENYIIGLDMKNSNVKVMRIEGTSPESATVEFIPFEPTFYNNADYHSMLTEPLSNYFAARPFKQSSGVFFVLPNNIVGIDTITVPILKKSKTDDAVNAQMQSLYKNYNDLKFAKTVLDTTKTNVSYSVAMVLKPLLATIYKALAQNKLYVKTCTFSAAAADNSVFHFAPKTRKKSFIAMDILADSTQLSVCSDGITTGFMSLPFGFNQLYSPKIVRETLIQDHDFGYLAVQNAQERAKQKRLSTAFDPDDMEDAAEIIEENAISVNQLSSGTDNGIQPTEQPIESSESEGASTASDEAKQTETPIDGNSENHPKQPLNADSAPTAQQDSKAESAVKENSATQADGVTPVVEKRVENKAFVRKIKRLPQYMQREVPETQEGMAVENFRLFTKWALLLRQYNQQSPYIPEPEFIIVNLPKQFRFVIDKTNELEGKEMGIELIALGGLDSENTAVQNNLDLYGALFMNQYNKSNNF